LREDFALAETKRALSDVLRCNNLVVLSGLGTSLCVQPAVIGGAKAPTMRDLWLIVAAQQNAVAANSNPPSPTFLQILEIVGHPQEKHDIEALLSRCRLAESFLINGAKDEVAKFIVVAEALIISSTSFVGINHPLPVHGEFLRRAARRSRDCGASRRGPRGPRTCRSRTGARAGRTRVRAARPEPRHPRPAASARPTAAPGSRRPSRRGSPRCSPLRHLPPVAAAVSTSKP